jgi:hypothetical protein
MATAIQLPVQRGAKYLAKARKQQKEAKARFFDKNRAERAFEAQAMVKFETFDYLHHFIHNSEWKNFAEQITIDWESLPPKSEVESYGKLNKAEGTRACRKLFKAAVIWDDLGCSLWECLSGYNNPRNMNRILEEDESSSEHEHDNYTLDASDPARRPSISSKVSQGSAGSRRPSADHLQDIGLALERTSSAIFKGRRSRTEPIPHVSTPDKNSHIGFPRILSHNVRRTMGSFGESMIQGHGGRAM